MERRGIRLGSAAVMVASLLTGCGSGPERLAKQTYDQAWPPPPETARVVLKTIISRPEDLDIRKGFGERLLGVVQGEPDVEMVRPMAALTDGGGTIYVADPGREGVHRYDTTNGKYKLLRGEHNAPLPSPVALARGPGGTVYVSDSVAGEVYLLRPGRDQFVGMARDMDLSQPTGIAVDHRGRLYVADTTVHAIKVFTADGDQVAQFGSRGGGQGEFNYPTLLWLDHEGRLFVTDSMNFRIQIVSTEGRYLGTIGSFGDGTGDLSRAKGVAADSSGHVYVVDALFHAFQIFDLNGNYLLGVGEQGRKPGQFWLPTGIYIDEGDSILVCDTYNGRVQVFQYMDTAR